MKIIYIFLILLVIGVALIITKPSDEQCIELIKSKLEVSVANSSRNNVLNSFMAFIAGMAVDKAKGFIRIEDKTFCKYIYLGNVKLGTAAFGTFIVDDDLQNNINNINNTWEQKVNNVKQSTAGKIKSLFSHKQQNNYIGSDLQSLQRELNKAMYDLQKLKEFHFLRSTQTKQLEIAEKEQYIQTLEYKIQEIQRNN